MSQSKPSTSSGKGSRSKKVKPTPEGYCALKAKFKDLRIRPWNSKTSKEKDLMDEMIRFASHEEARTVPQFLALKQVGYSTMKHWIGRSFRLKNAYEAMIAILWCKWFEFGMRPGDLPKHQEKILDKYLSTYDEHLFDAINTKAQELAVAAASTTKRYMAEDYQTIELSGSYQEVYESNERKRIDPAGEPVSDGTSSEAEQVRAEGLPGADSQGS